MKVKFFLILMLIPFSVFANYTQELEKSDRHLANIKNLINQERKSIIKLKDEKKRAAKQYNKAKLELSYQQRLVKKLNGKVNQIKRDIGVLEREKVALKKQSRQIEQSIKSGNLYLAGAGESELLEALILEDELTDLTAAMQIISKVNANLFRLIEDLSKTNEQLENKISQLDLRKANLSKASKEKDEALKKLNAKKQLTRQMYKATQEDEKIRLEYLKILQSKEKELQKNIKKIEKLIKEQRKNRRFDGLKMEISSRKGKLSWPVMGEVFEKFGRKKVEGFRGIVDKKGIKIRPSIRTVSSVYDGIVIHTDSSWGLGQFIIVEHFGGYYTLYANLADVNVELEQKVKAGEPLGTIDIDHKANTPYLYFEIRKHDKAVDPLVWLSSL